jgi:hypothetical protein
MALRVHRLNAHTRLSMRALRLLSTSTLPAFGLLVLTTAATLSPTASALGDDRGRKWVASWASSMQGVFVLTPTGGTGYFNNIFNLYYNIQPDLSFAFPNGTTDGAVNQTLRLIVKPDLWGHWIRLRLSNVFGTQPVTFSRVAVGLQAYAGNIVPGTPAMVTFGGQPGVTIPAGSRVVSDPVELRLVSNGDDDSDFAVAGRNLAVSIAVQGKSGPMSYHDAAFATSYITAPNSGDHTGDIDDSAYPYSTVSWFFLDAVDVLASSDTAVVCAFGASTEDGFFSTLNGNDRWANDLSRRLHEKYGNRVSVVNEGIAGNTILGPGFGGAQALRIGLIAMCSLFPGSHLSSGSKVSTTLAVKGPLLLRL